MAIYGPHGSETKAPNKVDGKISDNQKTAVPKKPKKTKLSQSGKPAGDQQSKGRGRPSNQTQKDVLIDINSVVIDPNYLGRVSRNPELIDIYVDVYLAGQYLPLIRVEKGTNKLLDGYHRFQALKKIIELISKGDLPKRQRPKVIYHDYHYIKYEPVDVPKEIDPQLYSLNCNIRHGKPASREDIEAAVRTQFRNRPGYTVPELAIYLGISEDKARRHAAEAIEERNQKRDSIIIQLNEEGKTQEQIAKILQEKLPGAPGTSQPSVSKFLFKNSKNPKTNKTEPDTNKTDTASVSVENNHVTADHEKKEGLPPEPTPPTSSSNSLIAEDSVVSDFPDNTVSATPESDTDKICQDGICSRKFDGKWGPRISRVEALPSFFQDKFFIGLDELIARTEINAYESENITAKNLSPLPDLDLMDPITDDAKGNKDTSQNVSRLVTWVEPPRKQDKTNGPEINN